MKRILVLVLAAASLALPVPADAQTGLLCGFLSAFDPTQEGDTQTGQMSGGPLLAADVANPGEETAHIRITCTLQVGSQSETHADADD